MYHFALMAILFSLSIWATSCGHGHNHDHGNTQQQEEQQVDRSGPEYTSTYICPMHCPGSGSEQPGKCPKCEMDYVANKDHDHEGHDHDHDHEGHDHQH